MSKHTALIRLQAARTSYDCAAEACVHWDSDGGFTGERCECCYEMDGAQRELSLARKAWQRQEAGK